jgi:hypothetical protein
MRESVALLERIYEEDHGRHEGEVDLKSLIIHLYPVPLSKCTNQHMRRPLGHNRIVSTIMNHIYIA